MILFTDWFTPAYKAGGPIRSSVNFISAMIDQYSIYVLTSNEDIDGVLREVIADKWIGYEDTSQVLYLSKQEQTFKRLQREIKNIEPDFVYLNSMFSPFFSIQTLFALKNLRFNGKVVLAPRGMLHEGAIKFKYLKKRTFLFLLDKLGLVKNVSFQATDEQERQDVLRYFPKIEHSNISVVSNFPKSKQQELLLINKKKCQLKLVFLSRVSPKKNLLFFLEILKDLSEAISLELNVYGVQEDHYWEKCQSTISALSSNISIHYFGSVENERVGDVLRENHFFILSTLGENYGHAIFESFVAGRPVIISDQTPWKNLEEKKVGWDISLTNKEKWLKVVKEAAQMRQEHYDEWCKASWNYAHERIQNSSLKEQYLKLFS